MPARPSRILMVSSEVESFARTGGLGDVVLGLSKALAARGIEVTIVTPRYGVTRIPDGAFWWDDPVSARIGWGPDDELRLGVLEARVAVMAHDAGVPAGTLRVCLLDHGYLFGERRGIYEDENGTFGDNELRFAAMSRGALSVAEVLWGRPRADDPNVGPHVLHAHDWHASLSVIYAKCTMGSDWRSLPSVLTVHNLAFQGVLGFETLDRLSIPREIYQPNILEHFGLVNLLKGGVALADRVSTVSPTYAREIKSGRAGFGLDGFLRQNSGKLVGVLNGIDARSFDPEHDAALVRGYTASDPNQARASNKEALFSELGLYDSAAPLFASVSRLSWQKGIDILLHAVPGLVDRGARLVLVGTGDPALEARMAAMALRFPGRVAVRIAFDEALARRIYSGADFFFVPSRYEPCGLTQMYAMRYGAVPIVSDVGGLHDTVSPCRPALDEGSGFLMGSIDTLSLMVAAEDAFDVYHDRRSLERLVRRVMQQDFSWDRAAEDYLASVYGPVLR